MSRRTTEIEACRERPSCGAAVLDRRHHRRWHAYVLGSDGGPGQPESHVEGRPEDAEGEGPDDELEAAHEATGLTTCSKDTESK